MSSISTEPHHLLGDELEHHLIELQNATPVIASFLNEWESYLNKTVAPLYHIHDGLTNLRSQLLEVVWALFIINTIYFSLLELH